MATSVNMFLAALCILHAAILVQSSDPGTYEQVDEDMDILGMIDDEPEVTSFIQQDARLQTSGKRPGNAAALLAIPGRDDFADDFAAALAGDDGGESVVFMQTG